LKDLIAHLHDLLSETSSRDLDVLIKSENAAPQRRIAAILCHVAMSDLQISMSVSQLIISLMEPEWDSITADPMDTPIGRAVIAHLGDSPDQLRELMAKQSAGPAEAAALQLILRSLSGNYDYNESLDLVLRAITGHNVMWWIDWISEQRSRGK
jgi:hypothetical protein